MIQVLAGAFNRGKSTESQAVQTALVATDLKAEQVLLVHGVKFDAKHDNVLAKAMVTADPSRNGEVGVADAGLEYSLRRRHA